MGSLIKRGGVYFGKLRDLDGKIIRYSTGQRMPAKAGAILAEWERRVAAGMPARPDDEEKQAAAEARKRRDEQKGLTLGKLCDLFRTEYKRPKRIKSMARYWQTYGAYLRYGVKDAPIATLAAGAVRKADVEKWRDEHLALKYSPATVNVVLGLLTTVYNWAINDRELLNARNPCRGVEELPATAQAQIFELLQMQQLLRQPAAPMLRAMVCTVAFGGLRHGELCGLRRTADLFLDAPTPHLIVNRSYTTTPKGGRPRTIPLHPALVEALKAWLDQAPPADECADLVFPCARYDFRRQIVGYRMGRGSDMFDLIELLKEAHCPIPTESSRKGRAPHQRAWHALRHTFGTRCRDCGIPRDVISELLGHAAEGPAVTATYLHESAEHLARLATEIGRLWYLAPSAAPGRSPEAAPASAPPSPTVSAPQGGEGALVIDFATARAARARRAS